jgi:GAF domain-containing protein
MRALLQGEEDQIANLSNFCAALKEAFNWWWVGFYFVKNQELVLGPFQGSVACTRIAYGKGVCGTAWKQAKSIIVPDVNLFEGHIACSSASQSEIVLPVFGSNQNVLAVLDVDSEHLNHFDETDKKYLLELLSLLKF